jgi:hypothetical protein
MRQRNARQIALVRNSPLYELSASSFMGQMSDQTLDRVLTPDPTYCTTKVRFVLLVNLAAPDVPVTVRV